MARQNKDKPAERMIAEALRKKATELHLSNFRLTALPESLGQLPQLSRIDISGNEFRELPVPLAQIRTALAATPLEQTPGSEAEDGMEVRPCPVCRSGRLRVTGQFPPWRALPRPPRGASRRRE